MKKHYISTVLLLLALSVFGQSPTYWNTTNPAGNNSFPFNTTTSRKIQWRILANSLSGNSGPVGQGNNITVVYFQTGSTANGNYPLLEISLKQGPSQFSGGGLYETGMTTVYSGTNVNVSGTAGGWISFTLTTPFLYDPTLPLFVEVQHNATSGGGPTVYQNSPAGPGFGRLYGNYPNANYNGADQTVVNFGVDVIPATPCTGVPPTYSISPAGYTTCPGIPNPPLGISQSYSLGGLQYQWMSSTVSPVGPFSAIPGATMHIAPGYTIGATTWYQLAVTCTNSGGGTTTLSPTEFLVAGSTTNSVKYYEGFENIQSPGRLPNCSWWATGLNGATNTYMGANTGNRIPRTGNNFAAFSNTTGVHIYYTNGIWMDPGVTYSASMWYQTDLAGSTNFSNLQMLYGTSQVSTGLTPIAEVNGAVVSPFYKQLANTFTVSSSGLYYVAIKVNANSGGAPYLSWDDLEITIPCQPPYNPLNMSLSANNNTICQNQPVILTASGADSYTWSTGANGQAITEFPQVSTTYYVTGLNNLTSCSETKGIIITVNPAPPVSAIAYPAVSCAGSPVILMANGASGYVWNTSATGSVTTVSPGASTSYAVIGTGTNGCQGNAAVNVVVNQLPVVNAAVSNPDICKGDALVLSGTGAQTYQWTFSGSGLVLQGQSVSTSPQVSGTYTVTGTDANGCKGTGMVSINVEPCTDIAESGGGAGISIYPNPASALVVIQTGGAVLHRAEVIDLTGRIVMVREGADQRMLLNIAELSSGVYHLKISAGEYTETRKLIRD